MPLDKQNEESVQWGVGVQQTIATRMNVSVNYAEQRNRHVFSRTYVNLIDPVSGKRPMPDLDQSTSAAKTAMRAIAG